MMPKQREIESPLLKCLEEMGGRARPPEIYACIRKYFPNLTDADVVETLPSGGQKWTNRIQWVRQRLVSIGEMASPEHGVWAITDKGRRRLEERDHPETARPTKHLGEIEGTGLATSVNLEELADEYL